MDNTFFCMPMSHVLENIHVMPLNYLNRWGFMAKNLD